MEKRISVSQYRSAVRVAQACNPLITKRDSIKAKIAALYTEYNGYDQQVKALEAGIKSVVGFSVEDLVKKVIIPGTDGNGKAIKTTKYVPTSIVSYDEEKKQYVITIPDEGENVAVDSPIMEAVPEEPVAEETPVEDPFNI